ncbi:molybdenum cofactor synthesis domain protein [Arcobacter nitrofigilis DSM 7299]|uniref:Molybdopterin molybdenumtransferase n=1 Tax=Arcobacter nitrofigilis (strain ATCC 33309 / DSM 7299 / CCUG 15893 / LMG 7604 / NCTC 12251 / CI) TaxID=572480 RepID=D5UZC9_ARCNC|nr:molybdopterin molybdotransferase MoeA [Arcobacter nitrofigilis]ADG92166.1 molybdenum cofactor synthesis domain protein [Arcobacter nitrofigilis DSM 7299]
MSVSIEEALNIIVNSIQINKFEIVPIENATSRISAENLHATISLPKFNNSAMDGYAILFEDKDKELTLTNKIFAGDNNQDILETGTTIKIMTGARVPQNCEAVVPQENTQTIGSRIKITSDIRKMQHIRFIGEDIQKDEILVKKGEELNFSKITLLASQGISHVKVYKKPKVVVFASGEELKLHYQGIKEYQIYNSNTPTFIARTKELGCDVSFIGQAKDSIESIKEHVLNSLGADLIITSGGVSVGEADFTRESFTQVGLETLFDGVNVKPGKPTIFGKIKDTFILNLPGNPLASAMVFEMLGQIIIQKMIGSKDFYHNFIMAKLDQTLLNKKGRLTLLPGFFDGEKFTPSDKKSPGMVSVLCKCNSFIALDENVSKLNENQEVKVIPINWKFFCDKKKDYITYE